MAVVGAAFDRTRGLPGGDQRPRSSSPGARQQGARFRAAVVRMRWGLERVSSSGHAWGEV